MDMVAGYEWYPSTKEEIMEEDKPVMTEGTVAFKYNDKDAAISVLRSGSAALHQYLDSRSNSSVKSKTYQGPHSMPGKIWSQLVFSDPVVFSLFLFVSLAFAVMFEASYTYRDVVGSEGRDRYVIRAAVVTLPHRGTDSITLTLSWAFNQLSIRPY
jgi:hypothetical protein